MDGVSGKDALSLASYIPDESELAFLNTLKKRVTYHPMYSKCFVWVNL